MGQRANYVLVEESGRWSLFYSHWAANTIDRDLFWGPDHAIAFVRAQRPTTEWLDASARARTICAQRHAFGRHARARRRA
jgi:hypothetical protein